MIIPAFTQVLIAYYHLKLIWEGIVRWDKVIVPFLPSGTNGSKRPKLDIHTKKLFLDKCSRKSSQIMLCFLHSTPSYSSVANYSLGSVVFGSTLVVDYSLGSVVFGSTLVVDYSLGSVVFGSTLVVDVESERHQHHRSHEPDHYAYDASCTHSCNSERNIRNCFRN